MPDVAFDLVVLGGGPAGASAMHLFATVTPEQLLPDGLSGFFDSIAAAHDGSPP